MNSRERVLHCLDHEPADRLPLDGSFHAEVWPRLKAQFGTDDEEAVLRGLGIDFRGVGMEVSDEFRQRATKTPQGWLIRHPDGSLEDEWGVRIKYDEQQRYYRYVYHPLADEAMLESFEFPDLDEPGHFEEARRDAQLWRDEFVVMGGTGTFYRDCWFLRGMQQWMMDLILNPDFVVALTAKMLKWKLELLRRLVEVGIDIFSIGGDIAMQQTLIMHPDVWRRYFKPCDAALIEEGRTLGVEHFYFHSDGNIMPVLDDLVEIGFDILDPVQPECLDPAQIKRRYGDRITLHGTVSAQQTLPFGTPADVRDEVVERVRTLGYNGGLVIAPNNVAQPDVPLENLLAMYDTVMEIGSRAYRLG
jgi:uroporphyrinogen decarboxylase